MRFAILGSGAVGGYFGARLWKTGHDVTFIARGAHLAAIREQGLDVSSPLGDVRATAAAEEDTGRVGVVDCVLVAVKNYDNATAFPMLRPMVGPATTVLTVQNGVDAIEECAQVVGTRAVLGGVTYIFATLDRPGRVAHMGTSARIVFGEVFDAPPALSPRVEAIARAFSEAGVEIDPVPDARPALWEKLAYLATFAGLTGASRLPIGPLWQCAAVRDAFMQGVGEIERVARAEGVRLPDDLTDRLTAFVDGLSPAWKSSLLVDLQNGRRIEVEALQGSVVRRGRLAGVPTPTLGALYAVLKPHEHGPIQA